MKSLIQSILNFEPSLSGQNDLRKIGKSESSTRNRCCNIYEKTCIAHGIK